MTAPTERLQAPHGEEVPQRHVAGALPRPAFVDADDVMAYRAGPDKWWLQEGFLPVDAPVATIQVDDVLLRYFGAPPAPTAPSPPVAQPSSAPLAPPAPPPPVAQPSSALSAHVASVSAQPLFASPPSLIEVSSSALSAGGRDADRVDPAIAASQAGSVPPAVKLLFRRSTDQVFTVSAPLAEEGAVTAPTVAAQMPHVVAVENIQPISTSPRNLQAAADPIAPMDAFTAAVNVHTSVQACIRRLPLPVLERKLSPLPPLASSARKRHRSAAKAPTPKVVEPSVVVERASAPVVPPVVARRSPGARIAPPPKKRSRVAEGAVAAGASASPSVCKQRKSSSSRFSSKKKSLAELLRRRAIVTGYWGSPPQHAHKLGGKATPTAVVRPLKPSKEVVERREAAPSEVEQKRLLAAKLSASIGVQRNARKTMAPPSPRRPLPPLVPPAVERDPFTGRRHRFARYYEDRTEPRPAHVPPVRRFFDMYECSDAPRGFFRNLTIKATKVALQHGLVQLQVATAADAPRFAERVPHARFRLRNEHLYKRRAVDARMNQAVESRWKKTSKFSSRNRGGSTYDLEMRDMQDNDNPAVCFLKNAMSIYLHAPHSPYGDVASATADMLRRHVRSVNFARVPYERRKPFVRFLMHLTELRGTPHRLDTIILSARPRPQPLQPPQPQAQPHYDPAYPSMSTAQIGRVSPPLYARGGPSPPPLPSTAPPGPPPPPPPPPPYPRPPSRESTDASPTSPFNERLPPGRPPCAPPASSDASLQSQGGFGSRVW